MSILFYTVQSLNSMQRKDMSGRKYESPYFKWLMCSFPNKKLGLLRVTAGFLLKGFSNMDAANTVSLWLFKIFSPSCQIQMSVTSYENTNLHWATSKIILCRKNFYYLREKPLQKVDIKLKDWLKSRVYTMQLHIFIDIFNNLLKCE